MPDRGPMVAGQPAADRLMASITYRRRSLPLPPLLPGDVADVLHALADHSALLAALDYRPDGPGRTGYATSLGRWLHAVADDLTAQPAPSYSQAGSSEPADERPPTTTRGETDHRS